MATNTVAPAAVLQALLDAAVDAIVMIDTEGKIVSFNRAAERTFGFSQEEMVGRPVEVLMPQPHRSDHARYLRRYLETGEKRVIGIGRETRARHASGREFPIWISIGEVDDGGNRRFMGIMRDLSAQKAAEEERHALETRLAHVGRFSLMGEMTAGIAHEINQPLSAIAMYSQAARRLLENPAAEKEALEKACAGISDQVHRVSQVIENLRSFIRKQDVLKEPVDLNDVIAGVMTLVLADARRADIEVTTSFASDLPRIDANVIQVQQVLLNLTRNAVDSMRASVNKHKGISISTFGGHGEVGFEVRDHGAGVAPKLGDSIFHPFVTTKPEGLGVGLAISRTIVHGHAGKLTYRHHPQGGAVFTVTLPAMLKDQ